MNLLGANRRTKNIVVLVIFICVSVFILLQSPLSPIGSGVPDTDSSDFIYMAQTMVEGQPLYVAAWDHKGPLQYIIDALGLLIAPGYIGIWILEVISMVISMVYVYKTIRLELNRSLSLVGTLSLFTLILATLVGGNLPEEFALPFICGGFYIFMRYFMQKKGNWLVSGLYLAVVILLKLNCAFLWVVFVPLVVLDMILSKDTKIVKYALFFLLGMVILMLPIGIYLVLTNSFNAMIESYVIFNFLYIQGASLYEIISACVVLLAHVDIAGLNVALTIGSVLILAQLFMRKDHFSKKILSIGILLLVVFGLFSMGVSGNKYAHYFIPLLVLVEYPVIFLLKAFNTHVLNKSCGKKCLSLLSCLVVVGFWILPIPYNIGAIIAARHEENENTSYYVEFIKENTNTEDTIQIMANHTAIYLLSGRKACCRFMFFPPGEYINTEFYQDTIISEVKEKLSNGIPRVVIIEREELLPFFSAELNDMYHEVEKNVFIAK